MSPARPTAAGFTFIEVLFALSILLVGSVGILSLFALGTHHMLQRRVEEAVARVTPEVRVLVQDHIDILKSDEAPSPIRARPLSRPDFSVDVNFSPSAFGGARYYAQAVILFRGEPVWRGGVLPPIPLSRSTLDPR
jgi:prepilin-type N-terminal cleavage/methylation domain-containing protein